MTSSRAPREWTPRDYAVIMSVGTACLCLIVVVLGAVFGVLTGLISPTLLGEIQGLSVGGGLLGFALITYKIIDISIGPRSTGDNDTPQNKDESTQIQDKSLGEGEGDV